MLTPHRLYQMLLSAYGPQNWWPVDSNYHNKQKSDPRFEIIIGAILTQNTAWKNVEQALSNLKKSQCLSIDKISKISSDQLKQMIQPSGFYNQKADRIHGLTSFFKKQYHANLTLFFSKTMDSIRKTLLHIQGIGPETADSILLYAGNLPIFVVDAYTKRTCYRVPISVKNDTYQSIQESFQQNLAKYYDAEKLTYVFQQLHALIVVHAKKYCKKRPLCHSCLLIEKCEYRDL